MSRVPLYQHISQTIASNIVTGELPSGARLEETSLAERFGVSRSPVRDALRHLAVTKLIEYQPRKGFSVANIKPEGLRDLYEGLTEVEVICAGLCAMRATMIDRIEIEKLLTRCATIANSDGDSEAYTKVNEQFHAAIYTGAHNKTLQETATKLRQQFSPFRTPESYMKGRIGESVVEHEKVVEAIKAQDKTAAMTAMRIHANNTATNVLDRIFDTSTRDENADGVRREHVAI